MAKVFLEVEIHFTKPVPHREVHYLEFEDNIVWEHTISTKHGGIHLRRYIIGLGWSPPPGLTGHDVQLCTRWLNALQYDALKNA